MVIIIIASLVVLSVLGISLRTVFTSDTFVDNWSYLKEKLLVFYQNYLESIVLWFKELIKQKAIDQIQNL